MKHPHRRKPYMPYRPQYFLRVARAYEKDAEYAKNFGMPDFVISRLRMAALQLRYAAQALKNAAR